MIRATAAGRRPDRLVVSAGGARLAL